MSGVAITEDDVHRHYWAVALTCALSARQPHVPVASMSAPTDHHTNALAGPSSLPEPSYDDDDVGKRHKTSRTPEEQERRRRKKEEKARRRALQAELDRALLAPSPSIEATVTERDRQEKKRRKREKVEERRRQEEQEEEDLADEAEIDELLPSSPAVAPLPTKRYKRNSSTFDRPDPEASSHPRPITTPRLPPIPIALPRHLMADVGTATPASTGKKTKKASSWPTWATSTPEFLKKRKRQEA